MNNAQWKLAARPVKQQIFGCVDFQPRQLGPAFGADRRILGYVAVETVRHLDLEACRGDLLEQLLGLGIFQIAR